MPAIIAFDLETQYTADEVGGWDHIRKMRLAVAVTYDPATETFRDYGERDVNLLLANLRRADLVVGYNLLRFDYEVLRAYTDDNLSNLPTVDMLVHLYRTLGWRPKLGDLAAATLGETKTGDGLDAVRWFRQGQLDRVIAYCRQDVQVTWRLYEFGRRNGYVQCRDRTWRVQRIPVRW